MSTVPVYRTGVLDSAPIVTGEGGGSMTDYLQVHHYVRILYRRQWLILGIVAAGLGCAVLLNWITTPVFMAQATLQIDTDLNVLGVDRPLLPVDQRDWMKEFLPTQLGILQSHELARAAHDDLMQSSRSSGGVPTAPEIVAGRSVSLVKDTRLVHVGYQSTDPKMAAQVANALAGAYVEQNLSFRTKASGDASDWLLNQTEEQRKLVNENEMALQRYRQEHGADDLYTDKLGIERANIVVQKLAALQASVTKAKIETIEKQAVYEQLSAVQASQEPLDTLPAVASNPYIQGLKSELTALQRQMAQTSKELGDQHPDFIKLQAAVQNAERKLQTEVSNVGAAIRHDFEASQSTERNLTAALERQKLEVQALNGKTVDYTALEREANSNREVLDKLLQRSREATLARQLDSTSVRIVDPAQIPDLPILPRKGRTLLIGLVGSGGFALVLVFALEVFNTRVRSPEDVSRHLRIRVLGIAPEARAVEGHTSPLLGSGAPIQFAELFQGLRTNLLASPELATGRTLLITSSEPGEGKTMSAANIAVSLAGLKQRVLLIDADLRKPRLHELFGEERQPGLADVLIGKTTTRDFRKTSVSGLWLMPAGGACKNAANLLGSENFNKLIDYLKQHFDWIVLDSAPVLAVTDPCLVARVAAGVLLIVDCKTDREVASAAVERLDAVGATIVGAMLNRAALNSRDASYLPYYHRNYETYYSETEGSFHLPEVAATALQREQRDTSS